jgi:formylglycine-generating enzyme required for sulfatase activity
MDATEVTQAEYRKVMGKNPSHFSGCDDCPVEQVSWNKANEYAKKVGKRLPTEAEWEYAARGGNKSKGYRYSGSNGIDAVGWYDDNSSGKTHPVAQKQPNELGLYDMSGNVWEWCSDWYGSYSSSPQNNPQGPNSVAVIAFFAVVAGSPSTRPLLSGCQSPQARSGQQAQLLRLSFGSFAGLMYHLIPNSAIAEFENENSHCIKLIKQKRQ